MGQTVGRMPDTWDCLLEEKDRVLYWSGEVLSRVADNVNQEESLLIDYGHERIDEKVDSWIESSRARIDRIFSKHPNLSDGYKARVINELEQIKEELRIKMINDYCHGYKDLQRFTRRVDRLGERQRKVHEKIQELQSVCDGNVKKFQKKFGPLRAKTFKNLTIGEKMIFQDKRLKRQFAKQVYNIDHKNVEECAKCVDKLIKTIEKASLK
ncbi:hypothetical protein WH47_10621 [Habropoda laboriosa]|uniref:Uncharacterized protein n=1 Tax=Habropoda laboriosa TaxID=597456 RepID=A0A0L7QLH8_9HYME|nr:PREDICTED: uncharacterized protein LOC108577618 [Habropoda laboriosa]KOC59475.1 hypothetical protein WH47_10621 [Habropoda laboriosa]